MRDGGYLGTAQYFEVTRGIDFHFPEIPDYYYYSLLWPGRMDDECVLVFLVEDGVEPFCRCLCKVVGMENIFIRSNVS